MSKLSIALSAFLILTSASQMARADATLTDTLNQLLKQMDSDDSQVREQASADLIKLPPAAYPLVLAALKRPDLSPEVHNRLEQASGRLRWNSLQAAEHDRLDKWYDLTLTDAYEKLGSHSAKWDRDVKESIYDLIDVLKTEDPQDGYALAKRALLPADRALAAGCDDGLAIYVDAMLHQRIGEPPTQYVGLFTRAADRIRANGKYPPARIAYVMLRAAQAVNASDPSASDRAIKLADEATAELPAVLTDPATPQAVAYDLPWDIIDLDTRAIGDRKPGFERVDAAVAKALPDSYELHVLRGHFYVAYAWDVRTGNFSSQVPPAAWPKFSARLEQADKELTRAYEIDPTQCRAPDLMLDVELGQGQGKSRMELWYKRALDANPCDVAAARAMLNYLDPKWYGSFPEMIEFARGLLKQGDWESGLPTVVLAAHQTIAYYASQAKNGSWEPDGDYLAQADVWADLKTVFEQAAVHAYASPAWMTLYAVYASKGRHWSDADRAFKLLGDQFDTRLIHSHDELVRMREDAARHASGLAIDQAPKTTGK